MAEVFVEFAEKSSDTLPIGRCWAVEDGLVGHGQSSDRPGFAWSVVRSGRRAVVPAVPNRRPRRVDLPRQPCRVADGRLIGYHPAMTTFRLCRRLADFDGAALRRLLMALLFGVAGGAVFAWLDLPLPWMLGAMTSTMAASLAGARITVPQTVRQPMIAVVGVMLGGAFTPERLQGMLAWLPSMAILPIYVLSIGVFILFYLRKISGFDHKTAFFAATPGGLSEMVILADQIGGDMRSVALFHAARLVLIVFSIPLLASLVVSVETTSVPQSTGQGIQPFDLLVLVGLGVVGWTLANRLGLPAPAFMGPLFASTVAHLIGVTDHSPPYALVAGAQLVIGSSVGARFSGVPIRLILRTLAIGTGGTLLMFGVTLIFALVLHQVTGNPLVLLLLALIPGGFPEMSLIALGMGMDPAFVVTHHGLRVFLVVTLTLPIFSWLSRSGWFRRHWP